MSGPIYPNCPNFTLGEHCYNCGVQLCSKIKCGRKNRCPAGYTKEHIPPKSFFEINKIIDSIDSNPPISDITVPSCLVCNNKASINDEYFVRYIVIMSAVRVEFPNKLLKETIRKFKRNQALIKEFSQAPYNMVDMVTPNNILVAKTQAIKMPEKHKIGFFACLEKIVKGLYYKHLGHVLTQNIHLAWTNSVFLAEGNILKIPFLPDNLVDILRTAFKEQYTERREGTLFLKVVNKGFQTNNFRYAFIFLRNQDGEEYLIVFLSFYEQSEFIYVLTKNNSPT